MPAQAYNYFHPALLSYMESQISRDREWVRTPGFNTLKAREYPVNPYRDFAMYGTSDRTPISWRNTFSGGSYSDYLSWQPNNGTLWSLAAVDADRLRPEEHMRNEATIKALLKASDAKTNITVFYAEARKVHNMMYDRFDRLIAAFRAFKRGDTGYLAKVLNISPGRVHNTWLEYKFGWMPLIQDVVGAAEFFAQQFAVERPFQFTVRGKSFHGVNGKKNVLWTDLDRMGGSSGNTQTFYEYTHTRECKVKIWLEISNLFTSTSQQLGITNPLTAAWELLPWSFLIDYFIEIGNWLQAMTALNGLTVRKAMYSHNRTSKCTATERFSGSTVDYYIYDPYVNRRELHMWRDYRRDPITAADLHTGLIPVVHNPLQQSLSRWLNMAALLRSQMVRRYGNSPP